MWPQTSVFFFFNSFNIKKRIGERSRGHLLKRTDQQQGMQNERPGAGEAGGRQQRYCLCEERPDGLDIQPPSRETVLPMKSQY